MLLLIDVSGSMKNQTDLYLRFAHALARSIGRLEVFTLGTRLTRITRALRRRNRDQALALASTLVADWDGGTRLGDALQAFLSVPRFVGFARGALCVVLSDGLERGAHAAMTDGVARLSRNAWPILWLSPLAGEDGYAVETAGGTVYAGKVVLAAGLGNARLGPMVGLRVPTAPDRGHILVAERPAPLLSHPMARLRQTEEGTVMIGASSDRVGEDTSLDLATVARLAARARRILPAIGRARIVRSWSALRVMSPDGFPIYAESETNPGAYVVTCHSGVTLAAAHALDLAPALLSDGFNEAFAAFAPDRFDTTAAA